MAYSYLAKQQWVFCSLCMFLSIFLFSSTNALVAQNPTHMWAQMTDSIFQEYPQFASSSGEFQDILDDYNATQKIAFLGAKTKGLQKVLLILCSDPADLNTLKTELEGLNAFSLLEVEHEYETLSCTTPATYNDPGSLGASKK